MIESVLFSLYALLLVVVGWSVNAGCLALIDRRLPGLPLPRILRLTLVCPWLFVILVLLAVLVIAIQLGLAWWWQGVTTGTTKGAGQ